MTQHDPQGNKMRQNDQTESPEGKPSQAEGERNAGAQSSQTQSPEGKPSQAEGDRETVDEDLSGS